MNNYNRFHLIANEKLIFIHVGDEDGDAEIEIVLRNIREILMRFKL